MKNPYCRKKLSCLSKLFAYVVCLALLISSILPGLRVNASELQDLEGTDNVILDDMAEVDGLPSKEEPPLANIQVEESAPSSALPVPYDPQQQQLEGQNQAVASPAQANAGSAIYLNGQIGDDNNSGESPDQAVKTFDKARALAAANTQIQVINVTGTVVISGDISLSSTNAILQRDPSFSGYLLSVKSGTAVNLRDITIDGNSGGIVAAKSLIHSEGTLNILDNAVLQNNKLSDAKYYTYGGAIFCSGGIINMAGGSIQNNECNMGSGIYIDKNSTLQMTGGLIQNNRSEEGYKGVGGGIDCQDSSIAISGGMIANNTGNGPGGGIYCSNSTLTLNGGSIQNNSSSDGKIGFGGGVYCSGSSFVISGGAITGNTAWKSGGGIACVNSTIQMTSGTISSNVTDRSGGGIYFVGGSDHQILGGLITGNTAKGFWGGGGFLIESGTTVKMSRTLITQNTVKDGIMIGADNKAPSQQGGGLWNCPTGQTTMYVTNGLALFTNSASDRIMGDGSNLKGCGDDFVDLSAWFGESISGTPASVSLAPRMLGGGYRLWYQDGSNRGVHLNWDEGQQGHRCDPQNPGTPLPYNTPIVDQKGKHLAYKSLPSKDSKALAQQLATVIISENIATGTGISGGGIANNGHIIFGEDTPYKIIVKKAWAVDPSTIPDAITLKMYVGDHYIQDVELTKANHWEATVEDFPDPDTLTDSSTGELLPITFREPAGSEYILSIDGYSKDAANRTYTIQLTNSLPPEPTKPTEPPEVEVPPPPSVSVSSPIVFKKIDGGQPETADTFTFRIEPVSYRPDPTDPRPEPKPFPLPQNQQGVVREVQISGEGTISTGQISYTQPGYYEYKIQELDARDGKYTYSTDVYTFVDHVYLQDGQLMVDRRVYKNGLDSNTTTAYFTNLYQGKPPISKGQVTSLPATGASDNLGWSISLTLMGVACLALIRKKHLG